MSIRGTATADYRFILKCHKHAALYTGTMRSPVVPQPDGMRSPPAVTGALRAHLSFGGALRGEQGAGSREQGEGRWDKIID